MLIPSYYNWGDERKVYWGEKSHVQVVAGSLLFQPASSIQLLSANSYNPIITGSGAHLVGIQFASRT